MCKFEMLVRVGFFQSSKTFWKKFFSLIHKMQVLWEIDLFSDLKGSSLIKVVMAPETIVVFSKAALVFFFNILHYPFSIAILPWIWNF